MARPLPIVLALLALSCKSDPAYHTPVAAAETFARALEDKDYSAAEACLVKDSTKVLIAACNAREREDECAGIKKDPCAVPKDRVYPDCNEGEVASRLTDALRFLAEAHAPCTVTAGAPSGRAATAELKCAGLEAPERLQLLKEGANWRVVPGLPMFPVAEAQAARERAGK